MIAFVLWLICAWLLTVLCVMLGGAIIGALFWFVACVFSLVAGTIGTFIHNLRGRR